MALPVMGIAFMGSWKIGYIFFDKSSLVVTSERLFGI